MIALMNLHAHIDSAARDCDGLYTRDYVMTPNGAEHLGEFGELEFRDRVMGSIVSMAGLGGVLTVTPLDDGMARLEWNEPTDEGYRQVDATFCIDDCDTGENHFRDHAAEAAGY